MDDLISRQAAIDKINEQQRKLIYCFGFENDMVKIMDIAKSIITIMPSVQPERKTGHWIKDRSGAYCCSKCMEPCASYVMMKPRDKFCKMCGSRNEVME